MRREYRALAKIGPAVRKRPIKALRLGGRAIHLLERSAINSIGQLIDSAPPWGIGPGCVGTLADIEDALRALRKVVQPDGGVDWLRYSACRCIGPADSANLRRNDPLPGTLQPSVRENSIRVLRLGARGINLLERSGINSIGQLIDAGYPWGIGSKSVGTLEDIEDSLRALYKAVQPDGGVCWQRYAVCRRINPGDFAGAAISLPTAGRSQSLNLRRASLDSLADSERRVSVKTLHLSARTVNSLKNLGVDSIGDLIDMASNGPVKLPMSGSKTVGELADALSAIALSTGSDGAVDWYDYAAHRNVFLLPKEELSPSSTREFLRVFGEVATRAVRSYYGPRGTLLLRRYLLRKSLNETSLAKLGRQLGQTREASRVFKDRVLALLKEAILRDDYRGCGFRFRSSFVAPLRRLNGALCLVKRDALPYSGWGKLLSDLWRIEPNELGNLEGLILAMLGYQVVHVVVKKREALARIIVRSDKSTTPFRTALRNTEGLLRTRFPAGLSEHELLAEVGSETRTGPALKELANLISSIPGVEQPSPNGPFRVRLEKLPSMPDQCERILRERGGPMHRRELAVEINKFKGRLGSLRTPRHVGAAMSSDERFKAIRHSGIWALAEWDIEAGRIGDVVASCLSKSGRPLTRAELYALVVAQRPVKMSSLRTVLGRDGRFRCVPPRAWELK